jgi:hypothetical protein
VARLSRTRRRLSLNVEPVDFVRSASLGVPIGGVIRTTVNLEVGAGVMISRIFFSVADIAMIKSPVLKNLFGQRTFAHSLGKKKVFLKEESNGNRSIGIDD